MTASFCRVAEDNDNSRRAGGVCRSHTAGRSAGVDSQRHWSAARSARVRHPTARRCDPKHWLYFLQLESTVHSTTAHEMCAHIAAVLNPMPTSARGVGGEHWADAAAEVLHERGQDATQMRLAWEQNGTDPLVSTQGCARNGCGWKATCGC